MGTNKPVAVTVMNPPRYRARPPSCSPRSSLEASNHPTVDSILKSLKVCSRRLQNVLSAHRDELQILERLYYKGKNQHRAALFWRRVSEMRRYGMRLDGMNMMDIIERLRCSFFGDEAAQHARTLRGTWTHYPDARYVSFVVERSAACTTLVNKMRERLLNTYRVFTVSMQSGAFIQLVLTLIAICSRIDIVLSDLEETLSSFSVACCNFLQILSPADTPNLESLSKRSAIALRQHQELGGIIYEEDIGSAIIRPVVSAVPIVLADTDASKATRGESAPDKDTARVDFGSITVLPNVRNDESTPPGPVAQVIVRDFISVSSTIPPRTTRRKSSGRSSGHKQEKRRNKQKKDEIDDIFGD